MALASRACLHTNHAVIVLVSVLLSLTHSSMGARRLMELYKPPASDLFTYHNGSVLQGDVPISVIWYGHFTAAQKSIVFDFLLSLTTASKAPTPSVSQWWSSINRLYLSKAQSKNRVHPKNTQVQFAGQVSDDDCSLGKRLNLSQLPELAARTKPRKGGIALVLTAKDVTVEGFCMSRCGLHRSDTKARTAYVWVGNSATQCPGQCAWPFHQPVYGPQSSPLVAPNGDVGMDGMIINIASMVAGAVTNPFGDGFYQGPKDAPLEAATACPGVYGSGAYPGYAGKLQVDPSTGASYNADGASGRKYLLPALFDPATSTCSTLV